MSSRIVCAVQVIDAKSFIDIVDRWDGRGEAPIDIELNDFLHELGLDVVVAANKMDKIPYSEEAPSWTASACGCTCCRPGGTGSAILRRSRQK